MKTFYEFWNQIQEQVPMAANAQSADSTAQAATSAGQLANQTLPGADPEQKDKLKMILGKSYPVFVSALGSNLRDPKFLAFLEAGLQDGKEPTDDKVAFSNIEPECTQLIPTQKEIDTEKSLLRSLKQESTDTLMKYFRGGTFAINNLPIVTCGGGKYIIDGHHRWSQVFCMNPKSKMKAIDMTYFKDPIEALKVTQLAIAATKKTIPVAKVQGINLIGIDEKTLKDFVLSNLGDNAYAAFAQLYKDQNQNKQEGNFEFILNYLKNIHEDNDRNLQATPSNVIGTSDNKESNKEVELNNSRDSKVIEFCQNYIWNNVKLMNETSKPIAGASARDYMPQTDKDTVPALQAGMVNWKHECLKLAGVYIRD